MKIMEIAPKVLEIIKNYRKIKAKDIATKLNIPSRRVYDVTIILNALDLIDIEQPLNGKAKIYVWKGTMTQGKTITFNSCKIRIETDGFIFKLQNKGTYAILEATRKLRVKNYVEQLDEK